MISPPPHIPMSSGSFTNPLVIVPSGANYKWYNCHFHIPTFFQFPRKVQIFILLSLSSILLCGQLGQWSLQFCKFSFFMLTIIRFGGLAEIMCVSFFGTCSVLCIYPLFVWSNFSFLNTSQWFSLPIQSCLILYAFCTNLLHSLIMWLMVSSLSPHNLHLLFYCVVSILALIWLVLMELLCDAIRRVSASLS